MPVSDHSNSQWASGSTRTKFPRSTSVEYENQSQALSNRRLGAPPSRNGASKSSTAVQSKPLSKNASFVPASEDEDDQPSHTSQSNGRGKSPLLDSVKYGLSAVSGVSSRLKDATFYVRQTSKEPRSANSSGTALNDSYNYSEEEREFQSQKKASNTHKKNAISVDNKAYRPSMSDLDESDEDVSDDGKRRGKKKKKKEAIGGPLSSLPVMTADKRRKKKGRKSGAAGEEEDDGRESDTERVSSLNTYFSYLKTYTLQAI
jgi:SUN domain-containing protein 1/2